MIRELTTRDADDFLSLRRAALLDAPLAFASSPDDDFATSTETVREHLRRSPDSVIFGAFGPELVGVVGLYRDRHLKSSHKVHLWGMYVAPGHRGQGVGAELLEAVVRHARELHGVAWVQLSVSSAADGARRLYERAGFESWGTEPDALRHGARAVEEHHMALRLDWRVGAASHAPGSHGASGPRRRAGLA